MTPEALHQMAKGLLSPQITALAALEVADGITMPPAMKEMLTKLKTQMNEFLGGLEPLDAVPAAEQLNWAMRSLATTCERVGFVMDQVNGIVKCYGTCNLELCGAKEELNGFRAKVKDNLLIPKETVTSSVEAAREEGRAAMLPEIVGSRKTSLELAGLPDPGEAILKLPATEFNSAREQAVKNLAALAGKGLTLGTAEKPGRGAKLVKDAVWKKADEFAGSMSLIEDLKLGEAAPAPGTRPDPLLGAPAAEGAAPKKARVGLC